MHEKLNNLEAYQVTDELIRTFRTAVRRAQEESRRLGVPNVYWINGHRYYELPDGRLSETDPWPGSEAERAQRAAMSSDDGASRSGEGQLSGE